MTDRDRDLRRLRWATTGRDSGSGVLISLVLTAAVFALAYRSSRRGDSTLILVVLLACFTSFLTFLRYAIYGPLIRELERLRAELDEVQSQKRAG
jgi:hypothetical protein